MASNMSFEFNGSTENVYCPIELLPHNESLPPAPVQEVTSLDLSMADYPLQMKHPINLVFLRQPR